jgi:hypothetical protein
MAAPIEPEPETRCTLCGAVAESTCKVNGITIVGCRCVERITGRQGGFVFLDTSKLDVPLTEWRPTVFRRSPR